MGRANIILLWTELASSVMFVWAVLTSLCHVVGVVSVIACGVSVVFELQNCITTYRWIVLDNISCDK